VISINDQAQVKCTNCQAVTTHDGKTVWVCEQCNSENQPTADVAMAQATVNDAASSVAAPAVDQPVAPAEAPSEGPAL